MKLQSLGDAMAAHVQDGDSVVLGAALEALIPFAAGYELIRQQRRDLTVVAPISDMLADVMIGAGTIGGVIASWVGNVSAGSGYNFRRALEDCVPHPVRMVDHSNFTLALALHAAALGVPHLPTRSTLGTDLLKNNPHLEPTRCPFTGDPLVAVEALRPAVAIVCAQRADEAGNAQAWGNLGVTFDAVRAARKVIVLAEEIVPTSTLEASPHLTIVPSFLTTAVVHQPGGARPSPVPGHYERDHDVFHAYHQASVSRSGSKTTCSTQPLELIFRSL